MTGRETELSIDQMEAVADACADQKFPLVPTAEPDGLDPNRQRLNLSQEDPALIALTSGDQGDGSPGP